jgi:hypothetical protein
MASFQLRTVLAVFLRCKLILKNFTVKSFPSLLPPMFTEGLSQTSSLHLIPLPCTPYRSSLTFPSSTILLSMYSENLGSPAFPREDFLASFFNRSARVPVH